VPSAPPAAQTASNASAQSRLGLLSRGDLVAESPLDAARGELDALALRVGDGRPFGPATARRLDSCAALTCPAKNPDRASRCSNESSGGSSRAISRCYP
jgi:hypothetical protein